MANLNMQSVVQKKSRNGAAVELSDGEWYSVFPGDAWKLDKVNPGDEIAFSYKQNSKGGRTYNNIQGEVTVVSTGSGAAAPSALPSGGGTAKALPTVGTVLLARDRSIARQNACNVAATVLQQHEHLSSFGPDDLADTLLAVAQRIEEYTTGDLDLKEAKAAVEAKRGNTNTGTVASGDAEDSGITTINLDDSTNGLNVA